MNVLLVNCPIRLKARPNNIPYGLATIAALLREQGHAVEIFDANAQRMTKEETVENLSNRTWDVAGVSGLVTTYDYQRWLIGELKKICPNAPVVSGGGLATSCAELLFKKSDVDVAVIGEGEQTMAELCTVLSNGDGLENLSGIWFRKNGTVVRNCTRENMVDLDAIPYPAWDLLPLDIYLKNPIWGDTANNSSGFRDDVSVNRSMNIISSRGCPYSCQYCFHLFGRSQYRFRSALHVIQEIEALIENYGVDFIGFVDDNMMASKKRLLEFCDLVQTRGLSIHWGCHGRVTSASPDVLDKMAGAGCVWIGYGIESGSQKILDAMKKKSTVKRATSAIVETRRAGIFANTTFIFGYPGETRETVQETIEFKRMLGIQCGSFFATPYPGTPLYEQVRHRIGEEEAFIRCLGDATDFSVNLTDFSEEEAFRLKSAMDRNEDVL